MSLVLLVFQIIISILLIIMILMQRSDNDGLGLGSSGGSNFLSSRGQANLMTKITAVLAFTFMANSLLLAAINVRGGANSIADEIILEQSKQPKFQVPLDGVKVDGVKVDGVKSDNVPTEAPITQPAKPVIDKEVKTEVEATEEKSKSE
jgi:preprotein translocase subunit SecG